jgi:exonuclease III
MAELRIASYNCHGMNSSLPELSLLCNTCQIICLQETWLFPGDLCKLKDIHTDFTGFGVSAIDPSAGIISGRPYGGVGIIWHTDFKNIIKEVHTGYDWVCGITVKSPKCHFTIFCVYLPYETANNIDDYMNCLAALHSLIEECSSSSTYVLGDFNCDVKKSTLYNTYFTDFVNDSGCILSDCSILDDVYTYVSPAWGTTSWLDHCVSTEDAHNAIMSASVLHEFVSSDHLPLSITLTVDLDLSGKSDDIGATTRSNLVWEKASPDDLDRFFHQSNDLLNKVNVDIAQCTDIHCKCDIHYKCIDRLYCEIVDCLHEASESLSKISNKRTYKVIPGWNDYVNESHLAARDAFVMWNSAGKPRFGPVFDIMKRSRAIFKYSLRYCKRQENQNRADALANKMKEKDYVAFWKDIKSQQKCILSSPSSIDGAQGTDEILNMWLLHYKDIFCKLKYSENDILALNNKMLNVSYDVSIPVYVCDIYDAISKLPNGKSSGVDNIKGEHLKYAGDHLCYLLSVLFNAIFVHGYLPKEMVKSVIVPIIKNKTKSCNDKTNYRPVTLANVISKVFERILLNRMEPYLVSSDNQFGFKKGHGTDMCIFVLKQVLQYYIDHGSRMYVSFLDASMAFDNLSHCKLFSKLLNRKVPLYIIRVLWVWYRNILVCVKWNDRVSDYFCVTNGVRQGGLLSPMLYNMYVDKLSLNLNSVAAGCFISKVFVNHLMYADDIVLMAPSVKGLQNLVTACYAYGTDFNITFNKQKTVCMIIDNKQTVDCNIPNIKMGGELLKYVTNVKYLGHIISNNLKDNEDIARQVKSVYLKGNTVLRKFKQCNDEVKCKLFKAYCTNFYCSSLWCTFTLKSMDRLKVAYNNIFRLLLGLPRWCSASTMFALADVPSFSTVLRKQRYSLLSRVQKSTNSFVSDINCCDLKNKSKLFKLMYQTLYT